MRPVPGYGENTNNFTDRDEPSASDISPFRTNGFFANILNPDFSQIDFKKRSMSNANLRMLQQQESIFGLGSNRVTP